ncbi:MAG: hypothetical protein HMLKMBBP_00682 [Planctomycetes bacterium]|nr:hypothetical protein [Planctomycetota bacterium]
MRRGPLVVALIVAAAAALAVAGGMLRRGADRPHVVLVTFDTFRADRTGRAASLTPRFDAFAKSGIRFPRAWTVAPLTIPAHASMLTGRIPPQHGLRTNHPPRPLPPRESRDFATVAEAFRAAGWRTAAFVSASVLRKDRSGLDAGFDVWDEVPPAKPGSLHDEERRGDAAVDAALAWMRGGEGPAFLWVHLFDPHAPYDAPPPHGAGPSHRADERGYDGEVAWTDACFGRLLDGFAAAGLDPIVCVTADHGEGLREHGEATHGHLLHEATLHVPLALGGGRVRGAAAVVDRPVSVREIAPTLLGMARIPVPEGMPSVSLTTSGVAADTPLYAETLYGADAFGWGQLFALRRGDRKIVWTGPRALAYDLAADPREERPAVHPLDSLPPDVEEAVAALEAAARTDGASGASSSHPVAEGSYVSGSGSAETLLRERNARRPDAYDRIGDLRLLEEGQALLVAGAAAQALDRFEKLAAADPGNAQACHWRARALERLGRPSDAAAAYRSAFALGWRTVACVEKGLGAAVIAARSEGASPAEAASGLAFAEAARAEGVPATARSLFCESHLLFASGDRAAAARSARRALDLQPDDVLRGHLRDLLRELGDDR